MALQTYPEVFKKLTGYDIITFDVFDTLITRCTAKPTDVFEMVEVTAKKEGICSREFAQDRVQAEEKSYETYGECASFPQIYHILEEEYDYESSQCKTLMDLEFETELQVVFPKESVRKLLLGLQEAGKQILLCSDMYLSAEQIRKLLTKCGYPRDLEILVSSEGHGTKYSGSMWKKLFLSLPAGKKVIHVGDNEGSDYRSLRILQKEALLLPSGRTLFEESPLYGYLHKYLEQGLFERLTLGYFMNCALFSSPFRDSEPNERIISVWGGAIFTCFMDFLVSHKDDSQLLFVTREGYLLQNMYVQYCAAAGIRPQENSLFYASRAATIAATVTSEEDVEDAMQSPEFQGTLGKFCKSRMNFTIPSQELSQMEVTLPAMKKKVLPLLKPYFKEIFETGKKQKEAYTLYTSQVRKAQKALTIVDVGYNGTIQYALSKILGEKVGGLYMFLNAGAYPLTIGCPALGMEQPRTSVHPVYDNLMFLEAVMQVPYGQLQKMDLQAGKPTPVFNSDANFSPYIPVAQEKFMTFTNWMGHLKGQLGPALQPNTSLAEAIWVLLLKFHCLPKDLLNSFWLADDYSGNPMWKYDNEKETWFSGNKETSLDFQLIKEGEHRSLKENIKIFVKKHIPCCAFEWASKIWMRYLK